MNSFLRWTAMLGLALLMLGSADTAWGQAGRRAATGYRVVGRTPWFAYQGVRRQLKLDDDQYNRLNQAYVQYWTPYNQAVTALPADLAEQERQKQMLELYGTFNRDFTKASTEVITDPQIRNRYNQLYLQYQGYGAFQDPAVQQRLKLTDEQRQAFGRYHGDWNQQMGTYAREYATDREAVGKRFGESMKQARERIITTLTPEQRKAWSEMSGEPYDYPADAYFGEDSKKDPDRKE